MANEALVHYCQKDQTPQDLSHKKKGLISKIQVNHKHPDTKGRDTSKGNTPATRVQQSAQVA